MVEGFSEFGLSADVLGELDRLGYHRPTAIQRAAIPILRRGSNAIIHAARGAGATAAYGLALIERLRAAAESEGKRALVVTPTEERARAIALELGQLARPAGIAAGLLAPAWNNTSAITVIPIQQVLPLMQSSALKLEGLATLVVHDVAAIKSLSQTDALESLLTNTPREAQRVFITSELNADIERLVEAHARKAMHVPSRPADAGNEPAPSDSGVQLEYIAAAGKHARQIIAERAAQAEGSAVVFARRESDRQSIAEELELRGVQAETVLYGAESPAGAAFGLGAPFDPDTMRSAFGSGGLVVVAPAELTHLQQLAGQVGIGLKAGRARGGDRSGIERFRDEIRRAIREEDVDAQMLVIEPLLDEFSAAEVAAAAAALLRKRAATATPAAEPRKAATGTPPAFVKLFLSVGSKDTIAAREIVGAITGEAGVQGDHIGKVEIRDTFSIVEVAADAAERVIRSLNGTSLRGRSLRVDYDRKPSTQRRPMPARRTRPDRQ